MYTALPSSAHFSKWPTIICCLGLEGKFVKTITKLPVVYNVECNTALTFPASFSQLINYWYAQQWRLEMKTNFVNSSTFFCDIFFSF